MLHHVTYATNRGSGTSRGEYITRQTNSKYTQQGVIYSRRQDSPVDGPRRSRSAFGAKIVYINIYGGSQVSAPAFGRGPVLDLGPVMVSAIVSHGLTSLRPLY